MSLRATLRRGLDRAERGLDPLFGADWNPLANLGPLGWFLFWIVAATGVYLFIFFDTGVVDAYASVEWLSNDHWFHAGVARSLHRYASDLMVVVMLLHLAREFVFDRYRGKRWFSWVTGVPIVWFVYMSGITGYWLVWDQLAQYVAQTSTELLDALPIFAEPIARNFLTPESLSSRFFTLLVFLHIAIPLILLLAMWIHIQRISLARSKPPRGLAAITLGALVLVSLLLPASSQGPADLATVPAVVGLDWFLLGLYPVIDMVPAGVIWTGALLFTLVLIGLPWAPPRAEAPAAKVFLDHCNGCARCVADCPYGAITLVRRSDGAPFPHEVEVDAGRCVACGICMGSCPSSTPFRRSGELITGIDLPERSLAALRAEVIEAAAQLTGAGRVLTIACGFGAAGVPAPGRVVLPCVAMAPPSLFDFILSRGLADGVAIAGCAERDCQNRLGRSWTLQRIARERDPFLRTRVPRARLLTAWAGPSEVARLEAETAGFAAALAAMGPYADQRPLDPAEARGSAAAAATATTARGARIVEAAK
ncbi:MAG TPA: cytochrome b N-terminal domain-containing protein [Amaricoccus sp.]|uniref:cytochrome b N-terminal domain-containing protein n=1 Tax=Amaricoccus sp. TaxID=1872485 RepID=UPI002D0A599E|nr:cytochrome b N-terminal domain-containing protein [Amaricoccus sp.]HMQ91836.1 cytochrome b N-terminal domain-containing protein [Amaricoccus sp.]HMR52051.1 cytochrome b N-terminal domain-containing protein [Amaricoccus sp.]HMR59721.1 cytochrome b N-terminal domain-containing protein [Amaricoccus sp.]HMT98853.1 cytochrome b N-terminal domain-containing protein [Amaricoccus sp.]